MKWRCQAYRGMDTYRPPVEVEANTWEEAAQKAILQVPFGDMMQCDPVNEVEPSPDEGFDGTCNPERKP